MAELTASDRLDALKTVAQLPQRRRGLSRQRIDQLLKKKRLTIQVTTEGSNHALGDFNGLVTTHDLARRWGEDEQWVRAACDKGLLGTRHRRVGNLVVLIDQDLVKPITGQPLDQCRWSARASRVYASTGCDCQLRAVRLCASGSHRDDVRRLVLQRLHGIGATGPRCGRHRSCMSGTPCRLPPSTSGCEGRAATRAFGDGDRRYGADETQR